MKYLQPDFYRNLVQLQLNEVITPAILQAGGEVLAAVHIGSTVSKPLKYKVWDIFTQSEDINDHLWGWIGPNDVDFFIVYTGNIPPKLEQHYFEEQQRIINGSLRGEIPAEQLKPIPEPRFYSTIKLESIIKELSESKDAVKGGGIDLADRGYTPQQVRNRTRIRFAQFLYDRALPWGYEHLTALLTSKPGQLSYLIGQDYAQDLAGRLANPFLGSEINGMRGQKQGKREYTRIAIERAVEEGADLHLGEILKLNAVAHDAITTYWELKLSSEVDDPFGNLSRMFLDESQLVADLGLMHAPAAKRNMSIL